MQHLCSVTPLKDIHKKNKWCNAVTLSHVTLSLSHETLSHYFKIWRKKDNHYNWKHNNHISTATGFCLHRYKLANSCRSERIKGTSLTSAAVAGLSISLLFHLKQYFYNFLLLLFLSIFQYYFNSWSKIFSIFLQLFEFYHITKLWNFLQCNNQTERRAAVTTFRDTSGLQWKLYTSFSSW